MKLAKREIFVVLLTLAVVFGGYYFIYLPSSVERNELRADVRMNQRALADLSAATISAQELDRQASLVRHEIAHFTANLPPEQTTEQIVDGFSQAAIQNHLSIQRIDLSKRQRFAIFSQQSIRIRLSGDCSNLYQFLQEMEAPARAARLTGMSLHKAEVDGDVSADLTVGLYFAPALSVGTGSQTVLIQPEGDGE